MDTIRALLKGETGEGCRTADTLLLSEEEVALVLFTKPGETLVLFVTGGGRGEGFVLLMCAGEAVTVLLILGGELVEWGL